jgi:hypothetical protein
VSRYADRVELLREIDDYLGRTGMAPAYFGRGAIGNTAFVKSLRLDHPKVPIWVAAKARRFMAANPAGAA